MGFIKMYKMFEADDPLTDVKELFRDLEDYNLSVSIDQSSHITSLYYPIRIEFTDRVPSGFGEVLLRYINRAEEVMENIHFNYMVLDGKTMVGRSPIPTPIGPEVKDKELIPEIIERFKGMIWGIEIVMDDGGVKL